MSQAQAQAPVTPPSTNKTKSSFHTAHPSLSKPQTENNNPLQNKPKNENEDVEDDDDEDIFSQHHLSNIPTSFSPSKARAQARQTHQLIVIKSWLSSILKHPQSHSQQSHQDHSLITKWTQEYTTLQLQNPNLANDQLQTFQNLTFANQSGDERRRLVHAARVEEVDRLRELRRLYDGGDGKKKRSVACELVDELTDGLDRYYSSSTSSTTSSSLSLNSLDSIAEAAVLLGVIPAADSNNSSPVWGDNSLVEELGRLIMERTVEKQRLEHHVDTLAQLQKHLERKVDVARKDLDDRRQMKIEIDVEGERMQGQTAQWVRETKQILMKIQEYQTRITSLERTRPGTYGERVVRVEEVVEIQDRVKQRKDVVGRLEDRIKAFHGLPPDLEASRIEVKRARAELDQLRRTREQLFEQIATE